MLYDLNIPWTPQTSQTDIERTLCFSQSLGYNVVALNHTINPPVLATVTNAIPQLGAPVHSSFPQNALPTRKSLPITLRRATITISDPSQNHRLPTLAAAYDLLAVRPTTEKAFLVVCTTMSEISLISLDLTTPFPFRFRPKPCMAAVNRGILFEICYSQLLSASSSDSRARALFIGNVTEIFRATKGRGIVLSSGSGSGRGALRAPADLVNLFSVWGLNNDKGLEALGSNPRSVVVNEGLKRRSFRGVVDIVQAEGKAPGSQTGNATNNHNDGDADQDSQKNNQQQQKQQKKKKGGGQESQQTPKGGHNNNNTKLQGQQQQGGGANGKRKHEGSSDHGGGGGVSHGDQNTTTGATPHADGANLSKRQAKKMKLAQRTTADTQ